MRQCDIPADAWHRAIGQELRRMRKSGRVAWKCGEYEKARLASKGVYAIESVIAEAKKIAGEESREEVQP